MCRFRSPFNLNRFPHVSQAKRLASSPWWVNVSVKVEEMKRSREEEGEGGKEGGKEEGKREEGRRVQGRKGRGERRREEEK